MSLFESEKKKRKAIGEKEWWALLTTENNGFLIERRSLRKWMGNLLEKIPFQQECVGRSG